MSPYAQSFNISDINVNSCRFFSSFTIRIIVSCVSNVNDIIDTIVIEYN